MFVIKFFHNGFFYEYREGQPCKDGLYKKSNSTFSFISSIDLELQVIIEQKKQSYNLDNYAQLRKAEYDKLNQYELRFDDLENGTTTWQDSINAIKAKYPKPSES